MSRQHPGRVLLQQYLEPQKISQNALARAIKVPPRRINEIVHEKRGITADTAVRLSIYFGDNAGYWMHLQSEYEIEKVKQRITIQLSTVQAPSPASVPQIPEITRNNRKSENSVKKRIMR